MSPRDSASTPLFRWEGTYWGFLEGDRIYDRHGRQVAWLDTSHGHGHDVYHLSGHFLGEWRDRHHVLRNVLRPDPVHRAQRAPIPTRVIPDPPSDHAACDPIDEWADALPWPLPPPTPPCF